MLSFDLLDPREPDKTAGLETLSLAGLIAAAISGTAQSVPMLKRLQATNPTLYATIVAAASAETAARLQMAASAGAASAPPLAAADASPSVLPPPFAGPGIHL